MSAPNRRPQHGLTLVELMVGLALSLLVLAGLTQVFVGSRQAYRTNEGLSRLQESGRFALEFLSRDIRGAGFMGCRNLATIEPNVIANPPSAYSFDMDDAITGANDVATGTLVGGQAVVPGTDMITLRQSDSSSAQLTGNMDSDNANIQVTHNPSGWNKGDALFITDCENADIFRATSVSSGSAKITIAHANDVNTDNRLSKAYGEGAMVMSFHRYTYYIALNPAGTRALYRDGDELVDGVRDMQILYGEDTDGDREANAYHHAGSVGDWKSVVAVRVCVVAESTETNVATEGRATNGAGVPIVPCNGTAVPVPDNRLAQAFTTTIGLRNRLP